MQLAFTKNKKQESKKMMATGTQRLQNEIQRIRAMEDTTMERRRTMEDTAIENMTKEMANIDEEVRERKMKLEEELREKFANIDKEAGGRKMKLEEKLREKLANIATSTVAQVLPVEHIATPTVAQEPEHINCRCMARVWGYAGGQRKGTGRDQCRLRRISNEDYCKRHYNMSKIAPKACVLQEPPEWNEMTLDEQRSVAETQTIKTIGLRHGRIDEWFIDEDGTKYPPGVDIFGVIRMAWINNSAFMDLCHAKVAAGIWKWEGGNKKRRR